MGKTIDREDSNYYCPECGGTDMQVTGWVRLNDSNEVTTEDLLTDSEDDKDWWCNTCEAHYVGVHANVFNVKKEDYRHNEDNMYVNTHD